MQRGGALHFPPVTVSQAAPPNGTADFPLLAPRSVSAERMLALRRDARAFGARDADTLIQDEGACLPSMNTRLMGVPRRMLRSDAAWPSLTATSR